MRQLRRLNISSFVRETKKLAWVRRVATNKNSSWSLAPTKEKARGEGKSVLDYCQGVHSFILVSIQLR